MIPVSVLHDIALLLLIFVGWQVRKLVDPIQDYCMPKQAVLLFEDPVVPSKSVNDMDSDRGKPNPLIWESQKPAFNTLFLQDIEHS